MCRTGMQVLHSDVGCQRLPAALHLHMHRAADCHGRRYPGQQMGVMSRQCMLMEAWGGQATEHSGAERGVGTSSLPAQRSRPAIGAVQQAVCGQPCLLIPFKR